MSSTGVSFNVTPITPLSLQAATWSYSGSPYLLREEGCEYSKTSKNCSQACLDVDRLFSNGSTFENCLAYPAISMQILQNEPINSQEQAVYVYGIIPNDTQGSRNIVNTVNSCLKGWANGIPGCGATGGSCTGNDYGACTDLFAISSETGIFPSANGSDAKLSPTFQCINAICNYVYANSAPSADIGGIGIYISYIIQISLILVCWLAIEYFRFIHPLIIRRLKRNRNEIGKPRPSRQKEILVESVIEFHRAQCYFMATILIAALVASNQNGLGASTFQQIFNNFVLLSILSIGGSLLIMFMLVKLRLAGHRSWYTFALSTVTLFLALGLAFSSGPHKDITTDLLEPVTANIPSCGTIDPTTLCLQGYLNDWQPGPGTTFGSTKSLYTQNSKESIAASAISLFLWLCLLLDGLRKLDFGRFIIRTESQEKEEEEETKEPRVKPFAFWARVLFRVVDFVITIGVIYLFAEYIIDLKVSGIGPTEWSFGQIVALTVWTPPLVQYAYLQAHGATGNRWHLPNTLTVVRKNTMPSDQTRGRADSSVDLESISSNKANPNIRNSLPPRTTTTERLLHRTDDRSTSQLRDID